MHQQPNKLSGAGRGNHLRSCDSTPKSNPSPLIRATSVLHANPGATDYSERKRDGAPATDIPHTRHPAASVMPWRACSTALSPSLQFPRRTFSCPTKLFMSEAAVDGEPRLDFRAPCLRRRQRGPTAASIETGQRSTREQEPRLQEDGALLLCEPF